MEKWSDEQLMNNKISWSTASDYDQLCEAYKAAVNEDEVKARELFPSSPTPAELDEACALLEDIEEKWLEEQALRMHNEVNLAYRKADRDSITHSGNATSNDIAWDDDETVEDYIRRCQLPSVSIKNAMYKCHYCGLICASVQNLKSHRKACRFLITANLPDFSTEVKGHQVRQFLTERCMRGAVQNIRVAATSEDQTLEEFQSNSEPLVNDVANQLIANEHDANVAAVLAVRYDRMRSDENGEPFLEEFVGYHYYDVYMNNSFLTEDMYRAFESQVDSFVKNGSGWQIQCVLNLDLNIVARYSINHVIAAGKGPVPHVPYRLQKREATISLRVKQNHPENECFKDAVLCALNHTKLANTIKFTRSNYDCFEANYNWKGIQFPATSKDIDRFQKQNPKIYINVFEYVEKSGCVRKLQHALVPESVDSLTGDFINLVCYETKTKNLWHYLPVVNLNRLLNPSGSYTMKYCERCHYGFDRYKVHSLEQHRLECYGRKPGNVKMPKKNAKLDHVYSAKQEKLSYVVYADLESCLQPCSDNENKTAHVPVSIGIFRVCTLDTKGKSTPLPDEYVSYVGDDCIEKAIQKITDWSLEVYQWNKKNTHQPIEMSVSEKLQHGFAKYCSDCKKEFSFEHGVKKVADHNHITGVYRAALCNRCNIMKRSSRRNMPVFFHNLQGYDGHFVTKILAKFLNKPGSLWKNLECIPRSSEKYISFNGSILVDTYEEKDVYFKVVFKDSLQFLNTSLDSLVANLDASQFVRTKEMLKQNGLTDDNLNILTRKGVFCYEWFDSKEKLANTRLPAREAFYSSLNKEECTESAYARAQKVWDLFNCKTFKDYMLLYLELDVRQLSDVFECFRDLGLAEDQIDPAHYFGIPGFSWDSAIKSCPQSIELLSNLEDHQFVKKGIRGGMTFVNEHHVEKPVNGGLLYIDANNLYGRALSMKLPYGSFYRVSNKEELNLLQNSISKIDLDSDIGYLFEVDLHYPPHVQDKSEDLPFAPEGGIPTSACQSEYMKVLWSEMNPTHEYHGYQKLLLTHGDKKHYIVHGKLLQFYLTQGMVLMKIHRALKFKQDNIFQGYINKNSTRRKQAKSEFEKDFYKLKNNALFGKSMEDKEKRMNLVLVTNPDDLLKHTWKPTYKRTVVFSEDLVGVNLAQNEVLLDKPIFIGQAVLDLSKLIMYEWRYKVFPEIEKQLNCKLTIVGGDTDSYFVKAENVEVNQRLYPWMVEKGYLDTSNYPKHHPLYSVKHKADLQCVKDEACGIPLNSFILLKPKCYSMKLENGDLKKRAKGVQRSVVAKEFSFETYLNCYESVNRSMSCKQMRFVSEKHDVYTLTFHKKALSLWEDKRVWINANQSLPYGNHKLENQTLPRPVFQPKKLVETKEHTSIDQQMNAYDSQEGIDELIMLEDEVKNEVRMDKLMDRENKRKDNKKLQMKKSRAKKRAPVSPSEDGYTRPKYPRVVDEDDDINFIDDSEAPRFVPAKEYGGKRRKVCRFFDEEAGEENASENEDE